MGRRLGGACDGVRSGRSLSGGRQGLGSGGGARAVLLDNARSSVGRQAGEVSIGLGRWRRGRRKGARRCVREGAVLQGSS
jgi:hypothetical protein